MESYKKPVCANAGADERTDAEADRTNAGLVWPQTLMSITGTIGP